MPSPPDHGPRDGDHRYDVFITSLTKEPEAVTSTIAETFGVSVEEARRYVAPLPSCVKRDLSLQDARRMEDLLSGTGAIARVRQAEGSAAPANDSPDEPLRSALRTPLEVGAALVVCLAVYWFFIHTPTMAGLEVHELGASSGNAVVLLHGYGAPGDDLVPLGRTLLTELPDLRIVVVEAPHSIGLGGRAWFNGPLSREDAVGQVRELLDELAADGSPKPGIVLLGFSQGADLAAMVSAQEDELAGTAILAGPPTPVELRGRLFIAHGRADPILSL